MGILKRALGHRRRTGREGSLRLEAFELPATGLVRVVGESHHQDALRALAPATSTAEPFLDVLDEYAAEVAREETDRRWFRAILVPEPDNEYDENAVAIWADGGGMLGYLSAEDAEEYAPVFSSLERRGHVAATVPAMLVGGSREKPSFGVVLALGSPWVCRDAVDRD